jgi:hypothetical protein
MGLQLSFHGSTMKPIHTKVHASRRAGNHVTRVIVLVNEAVSDCGNYCHRMSTSRAFRQTLRKS